MYILNNIVYSIYIYIHIYIYIYLLYSCYIDIIYIIYNVLYILYYIYVYVSVCSRDNSEIIVTLNILCFAFYSFL